MRKYLQITTALLLTGVLCSDCLVAEDHQTVAVGDWSEPVINHDRSIRARILVMEGRSRAYAGPDQEVLLYLEIENTNSAWGEPLRVYFDATALTFEVLDADGKSVEHSFVAGSGGDVGTCWITIPYDSSMRMRANPGGWGLHDDKEFLLPLRPHQGQVWRLSRDQEYYLTGTFKVSPPTEDTIEHIDDWRGELKFPKVKLNLKPKR